MAQESKEGLIERDHDPNLAEDGRDSVVDEQGNLHIFPLENATHHILNLEKDICWCLPEVISEGICDECKEKHPPFLIYHSWLM
jgi:hypothetical protein